MMRHVEDQAAADPQPDALSDADLDTVSSGKARNYLPPQWGGKGPVATVATAKPSLASPVPKSAIGGCFGGTCPS